jgi:peptidoglycan hydrolase-like protein with peptidoglycan-binding domain
MIAFLALAAFVLVLVLAAALGVFSSSAKPPARQTPPPSTTSHKLPTTPVALPTAVVRPGAVGNDVKAIQRALASTGHSPGTADGVYGQQTQLALKAFQRTAHLPADGIYGPSTRKALEAALNSG